jgi:predicted RNA-binding Zn ribbon-like protein
LAVSVAAKSSSGGWPPGPIPHTVFGEPCLDFVNSRFADYRGSGAEFDRLDIAEWRHWFLARWNFQAPIRVTAETIDQLKQVRSLLRELLSSPGRVSEQNIRRLNRRLAGSPSKWHIESLPAKRSQARLAIELRPMDPGWDSVIACLIVSFGRLATSDGLARVRRCGNPDCTFLFFDDSPNGTRRWCEAANCGNLVNARRFRASKRRNRRR